MNNSTAVAVAASVDQGENYFFSALNFFGLIVNTFLIVLINQRGVIPGKIPRLYLLNFLIGALLCCLISDRDFFVSDDILGLLVCKLFFTPSLYYSFLHASFTNTILLSIERYMAVVHPMKHDKLTPLVNAIAISLSWVSGFARQVNNYWRVQRKGVKCMLIVLDPMFYKIYGSCVYTISFLAPLVIMAFCDGQVLWTLRSQTAKMGGGGHTAAERSSNLRRKVLRELSYSVCATSVAHLLLTGPVSNAYLLNVTGIYSIDPRSRMYLAFTGLSCVFYVVTPLVYLFFMRSLRRATMRVMCCLCKRDELDVNVSTAIVSLTNKETSSVAAEVKF